VWEPLLIIIQAPYQTYSDFFESWISRFPRRTIEAHIAEKVRAEFLDYSPIPKFAELNQLWEYLLDGFEIVLNP
jgi:hypothetical protein